MALESSGCINVNTKKCFSCLSDQKEFGEELLVGCKKSHLVAHKSCFDQWIAINPTCPICKDSNPVLRRKKYSLDERIVGKLVRKERKKTKATHEKLTNEVRKAASRVNGVYTVFNWVFPGIQLSSMLTNGIWPVPYGAFGMMGITVIKETFYYQKAAHAARAAGVIVEGPFEKRKMIKEMETRGQIETMAMLTAGVLIGQLLTHHSFASSNRL